MGGIKSGHRYEPNWMRQLYIYIYIYDETVIYIYIYNIYIFEVRLSNVSVLASSSRQHIKKTDEEKHNVVEDKLLFLGIFMSVVL